MTQIAIVQPAAPKIPPTGPPPASSGSQQFSSHFDKAIADQKDQLSPSEGKISPRESKTAKPDMEKTPSASTDNGSQETAAAVAPGQGGAMADAAAPQDEQPGEEPMAASPAEIGLAASAVATANDNGATTAIGTALSEPRQAAGFPQAIASAAEPQYIAMPPVLAEETKTAAASTTDTLLAQLRNIIENSDETGTVTITREPTPPPPGDGAQTAQRAWQQLENQINMTVIPQHLGVEADSPPVVPAGTAPVEPPNQETSLRQNTQQQYFEAKINLQAFDKKEDALAQDRQQGNEPAAQGQAATGGQAATAAAPLAGDQTNTFAQSLATTQTPPVQPAADTAKTLTLPSGTVVREQEVIQQVLDRFHVSRRPLDTQINIKLHPAELGELKIDLTVKEGSIRANVVAQSQHAQEIIEKNLPRLRTVLEDQGFTVEHITVSSRYDSAADTGLFDRQLFSRNDYTPQANKRRHDTEAAFRLEDAFFSAQPATTGVNVKI